jgi:transposase
MCTFAPVSADALKRIGELYAIEAEIRGMTAKQRLAERQQNETAAEIPGKLAA